MGKITVIYGEIARENLVRDLESDTVQPEPLFDCDWGVTAVIVTGSVEGALPFPGQSQRSATARLYQNNWYPSGEVRDGRVLSQTYIQ